MTTESQKLAKWSLGLLTQKIKLVTAHKMASHLAHMNVIFQENVLDCAC